MSATSPDDPPYQNWVGHTFERSDTLTARLAAEFTATLAPHLAETGGAPLGLHWTLSPEIEPSERLGSDGHSRPGLHLPALPFPRRMWAGGELLFFGTLSVGDEVVKRSEIISVDFKNGSSGPLAFVTLRHQYRVGGELVLRERQDIAYRAPSMLTAKPTIAPVLKADASFTVEPTPILLFRYSAITFNAHRIHYDQAYATSVEGYAGLVVHGPLQATCMLNAAAEALGAAPRRLRYRALSPLIAGRPFQVEAAITAEGVAVTSVISAEGHQTMSGIAESF